MNPEKVIIQIPLVDFLKEMKRELIEDQTTFL